MATKKAKRPRRKKSLSSGGTKRKRRSVRKSKGFLSDATNPTFVMNAAKTTLSSAAGGVAGTQVSKWIKPDASKLQKALVILAVGIAGNLFGLPNMTAGAVGAMTSQAFPNGLADDDDDTNFADKDSLSDKPLFLDEDGQAMVLEESPDGHSGYRYLSDAEIKMLEEAGAFDQYEVVN